MRGLFFSFPSAHPRAWQDGMVSFLWKVCIGPSCFLIRLHMLPFATRQTTSACGGDTDTRQLATPTSIVTSAHAPPIISHNSFFNIEDHEVETSRSREARYHDLLEHRSNFLERRRRIRSQVCNLLIPVTLPTTLFNLISGEYRTTQIASHQPLLTVLSSLKFSITTIT